MHNQHNFVQKRAKNEVFGHFIEFGWFNWFESSILFASNPYVQGRFRKPTFQSYLQRTEGKQPLLVSKRVVAGPQQFVLVEYNENISGGHQQYVFLRRVKTGRNHPARVMTTPTELEGRKRNTSVKFTFHLEQHLTFCAQSICQRMPIKEQNRQNLSIHPV